MGAVGGGRRVEGGEGWGGPGQPPSLPQPERVLLALRRYLRAEQKEQRHTLRHYQHVAAVDPEKAQQMRFQVLSSSSSQLCHPSDLGVLDPIPQTLPLPLRSSFFFSSSFIYLFLWG